MMLARELSKPYAAKKAAWIRVPDDETWLKMLYMVLDGANSDGKEWVRAAGFEEQGDVAKSLEQAFGNGAGNAGP